MLVATGVLLTLAQPAAAATHEIRITDSAFATPVLTIRVGDTVTWTNADDRPHTATSEDGSFDSGNLDEGAAFSFTFTAAGTYAYLCEYHPDMRATIMVEGASAPTTQAAPAATPTPAADSDAAPDASHAGEHGAADEQPDTALGSEGRIPALSFLLWGAALIVGGIGLAPSGARRVVTPPSRPSGGWRR